MAKISIIFTKWNPIIFFYSHNSDIMWPSWRLNSWLLHCLFNRLSRRTPKENISYALRAFCDGNPSMTNGFPSQRASNGEKVTCDDISMTVHAKNCAHRFVVLCFNILRPRQNGRHFTDDTFKRIFLYENVKISRLKFQWCLFLRVQLVIFQHWFRKWLGASQATSHDRNQWWLSLLTHICVTRPELTSRDATYIYKFQGCFTETGVIIWLSDFDCPSAGEATLREKSNDTKQRSFSYCIKISNCQYKYWMYTLVALSGGKSAYNSTQHVHQAKLHLQTSLAPKQFKGRGRTKFTTWCYTVQCGDNLNHILKLRDISKL